MHQTSRAPSDRLGVHQQRNCIPIARCRLASPPSVGSRYHRQSFDASERRGLAPWVQHRLGGPDLRELRQLQAPPMQLHRNAPFAAPANARGQRTQSYDLGFAIGLNGFISRLWGALGAYQPSPGTTSHRRQSTTNRRRGTAKYCRLGATVEDAVYAVNTQSRSAKWCMSATTRTLVLGRLYNAQRTGDASRQRMCCLRSGTLTAGMIPSTDPFERNGNVVSLFRMGMMHI